MQVVETGTFIKLVIQFNSAITDQVKNTIDQLMLETLDCDGIEDLSLSEDELNELLGKEAVTGGPLPVEVLDLLDQYANNRTQKTCSYYFYGDKSFELSENAKNYLMQTFNTDQIEAITITTCKEEPWLEKWKEHYHPIKINPDFLVLPSWVDPAPFKEKTILRIDPGQAFGTGSHESTKLCLGIIYTHLNKFKNSEILDFGCGSGILALAQKLINPTSKIYLFDIDPAAYENIETNRTLNNIGTENTFLIPAGDELPHPWNKRSFDVVMANILLPILLDKAELLSHLVKIDGYLLISGIIQDQWNELFEKLSEFSHWEITEQVELNSWMGVLIKKIVH